MSGELRSARQPAEEPLVTTAERLKEEVLRRYQELVDQKYLRGLTDAEQVEMETLGREIDSFYDGFYEPILAELQARLKDQAPGS